jgi:hypothetical protein
MGGGDPGVAFGLVTPVGKVVLSDRPQLRWKPLDGADSYVVKVYDSNYQEVAASQPLKTTVWNVDKTLKRGGLYQWQVTANKGGEEIKSPVRPAPDARFRILEASAAAEIESAKRQAGNSHLLLGTLYANAGLTEDATREFQALVKENPNSELAKKLLRKVQSSK